MNSETPKKRGFTLIELLISLGIIIVISGLSVPIYYSFHLKEGVDVTVTQTTHYLRSAQFFAQLGERDDYWGVKIEEDRVVLFKGEDYSSRDVNFDKSFNLPGIIQSEGLDEVVFRKITGIPENIGNIVFSTNESTRSIIINKRGIIDYGRE